MPVTGLNYRWPDLPSLTIEARLAAKLDAVQAFAAANCIDKSVIAGREADIGIVTCGKAHYDLLEAFRRLGLGLDELDAAGIRLYKVGLSFPVTTRMLAFAQDSRKFWSSRKGAAGRTTRSRSCSTTAPRAAAGGHRQDRRGRTQASLSSR